MTDEKITARYIEGLVKEAVRSRNQQSNHDTWELVLTLVVVGLSLAGAVVFQVEIHDAILSFFNVRD